MASSQSPTIPPHFQSGKAIPRPSLGGKDTSEHQPNLAAPDPRAQVSGYLGLDSYLSPITIPQGEMSAKGKSNIDRPPNVGNASSKITQAVKKTIGKPSKTETQSNQAEASNAGRYWPVQRVWQITPQLTETIKVQSISPMAKWELESQREGPWNAIGEVYIDHPVDWSQEPTGSTEGDMDVDSDGEDVTSSHDQDYQEVRPAPKPVLGSITLTSATRTQLAESLISAHIFHGSQP